MTADLDTPDEWTVRLSHVDTARLNITFSSHMDTASLTITTPARSMSVMVSAPLGRRGLVAALAALWETAAPLLYNAGFEAAGGDSGAATVGLTPSVVGAAGDLHYLDGDTGRPVCGGWDNSFPPKSLPVVGRWAGAANILSACIEGAIACPTCAEMQASAAQMAQLAAPAPVEPPPAPVAPPSAPAGSPPAPVEPPPAPVEPPPAPAGSPPLDTLPPLDTVDSVRAWLDGAPWEPLPRRPRGNGRPTGAPHIGGPSCNCDACLDVYWTCNQERRGHRCSRPHGHASVHVSGDGFSWLDAAVYDPSGVPVPHDAAPQPAPRVSPDGHPLAVEARRGVRATHDDRSDDCVCDACVRLIRLELRALQGSWDELRNSVASLQGEMDAMHKVRG